MKLIKILGTIFCTFLFTFLFSGLLSWEWVQAFFARQLVVYVLMAGTLVVGWMVAREILK